MCLFLAMSSHSQPAAVLEKSKVEVHVAFVSSPPFLRHCLIAQPRPAACPVKDLGTGHFIFSAVANLEDESQGCSFGAVAA